MSSSIPPIAQNLANAILNRISDLIGNHNTNNTSHSDIRTAVNGKADSSHEHSVEDITDFPDSITPSSHSHGSLGSTGTLNSDISSVNKVAVTDSSNNLKTISQLPYSKISGTPTIPSKTSDLTNDSGFLTSHQDISGKSDVGHTHTKSEITDFPSTITPSSHAHGNITNDGKVGTASGKPLITTTGGAVTTGSFGSSSGTFCQGNDSRLSNARTPTSHTHGNLTNDGKVGTASGKIITTTTGGAITASDSITKSMISDFPTTMTPSSHSHGTGDVSDTSAYTNIGSSANATQKTINDKINTALGNKANSSNVYTKSETYTQSEITTLIANAVAELQLFEVVESLPTTNIKTNRLYLIVNGENIANNSYDIYLRVNNSWESLDALEFDISNFYTKTETDTLLNGKVDTSDSRLTDSRTPKSHTHGNITNTGAVGSTANKPLITTTNGVVTTGSFGTSANTFCQGNDSRLSDARTPTSHSHGSLANGGTLNSDITSVNKIAVTDSSNNLKTISQLPYSKISGTPTIPSKTSDLTNDSGFLTSHQDISGKIDTAGSGLSKSGTTLNHSNSVTAVTTAAFKKIKYDAQGHITGVSDVAKADITGLGIPSTDTVYTHPTYTARTGKPTANATPSFGGTFTVSQITSDSTGHVTGATDRTVTIPSLPTASTSAAGIIQIGTGASNAAAGNHTHSQYLTSHQDISGKANTADLGDVAFSNDYTDLDNLPSIPSKVSDLTNDSGFLTSVPAHTNATASVVGQATASLFGHAKAGSSTPAAVTTGTASVGTDNGLYARADHSHKHPTYTSRSAGLYRITVDGSGHVSAASAVSITYSNGVLNISY